MTIHADFVKILKTECSTAFSITYPLDSAPEIAFVDGQVKLMKPESIQTWGLFVQIQFIKSIEKLFALGAQTVVLGFDNYNFVPCSKTMTQIKRNKYVPVLNFESSDTLPEIMPVDWNSAMRNRAFKVKVIQEVLNRVRVWFVEALRNKKEWEQKVLVFDAHLRPEILHVDRVQNTLGSTNNVHNEKNSFGVLLQQTVQSEADNMWLGRGECDIKAFYWLKHCTRLLIVSTDGDFVPLAMLQLQKLKMTSTSEETHVILYRMRTQAEPTVKSAMSLKRKADAVNSDEKNSSSKREYEYVNIVPLMHHVSKQMCSSHQSPITNFCALIALCGCDFALNLPRLGPKSVWKLRHKLKNLDLTNGPQLLSAMTILYHETFVAKNCLPAQIKDTSSFWQSLDMSTARTHYASTLQTIQKNTKIAERVRNQLWNTDRIVAHAGNSIWTMLYWNELQHCPHPHEAEYGYIKDENNKTHFAFVAK